jgi:hypothetical protein
VLAESLLPVVDIWDKPESAVVRLEVPMAEIRHHMMLVLVVFQASGGAPAQLHIDWRRLPDRPVGTQDSLSGVIAGQFVVAMGNRGVAGKPAHAQEGGMWNGGHAFSPSTKVWSELPPAPATTPDFGGTVGVSIYGSVQLEGLPSLQPEQLSSDGVVVAGGFSHTNCSKQTFLLQAATNTTNTNASFEFHWTRLPDLPYAMAGGGLAADGLTIYRVGGADCGAAGATERMSTWADHTGGNQGFGQHVLVLALKPCHLLPGGGAARPQCGGWVRAPQLEFPGTPRSGSSVMAATNSIYVLGGMTYANATPAYPAKGGAPPKQACTSIKVAGCTANPVDNWRLDLRTMSWSRLPDNPHATGGTSNAVVLWRKRYIISVGVLESGPGP